MSQIFEIASLFPINTSRLTIRIFQKTDINEEYISWLNDRDVVKFSNQRFISHDSESCIKFFNKIQNSEGIFLLVSYKENKKPIGTMTVYFNKNHSTADIGIMFGNRSFWNKGLGEEAWSRVMDFLLEELKVRKVTGGAISNNKGMIKIFKKAGMVPDGIRKKHELIEDKSFDIVHFAKFIS